ncbi:hypothetical protein KP79_PYT21173 [Mizuhopecten yessoensis]|uniref:Uncharacterized protein n=1 Tax=Mizuhopecten yessoensis TaxID=6573 RepID=A0A210Q5K0_MIZYE|nr:hypothetical protein KP79_PYT21173 [Mizuhopecten yessoensis]
MGCTESRNMLSTVSRKNGKNPNWRWRRWRLRKVEDKPDSRTTSRIQNVSGILSKSSEVANPHSPRPKSKLEVVMADILEQNRSEEISIAKAVIVEGIPEDEETTLQVMEEKIKMWIIESCLRVNNSRLKAAKGPRKPVSDNRSVDITADVITLEQDMQAVIDGVDQVKSLSSIPNDKRILVKAGQDFCISQISNKKRVRPGAARGFRTPCTIVSAEEYVLPGAILDLSDIAARPHVGNGPSTQQDLCLQAWMKRQTSRDIQIGKQ